MIKCRESSWILSGNVSWIVLESYGWILIPRGIGKGCLFIDQIKNIVKSKRITVTTIKNIFNGFFIQVRFKV